MDNTLLIAIIGAIAGLISGVIASLIAPWINWGIEKKKSSHNERKLLLKEIREIIIKEYDESEKFNESIALNPDYIKNKKFYPRALTYFDLLQKHPQFQRIIPFLNEATSIKLKTSNLLSLEQRGSRLGEMPLPFSILLEDLNRIEKSWRIL